MASLASITAHLHVSVGNNEPVEMAEFQIPLEARVSQFGLGEILVSTPDIRENVAAALEAAASHLRKDL